MARQPESPTYDVDVYEWEITDPVQGGVGGIANNPILSLANRTAYLKQRLDALVNGTLIPPTVAPISGPNFQGSATAPNVAPGDDSQLIANTHFFQQGKNGSVVVDVSGNSNVTLTQSQWGVGTIVLVGVLTGNINVIFPAISHNWIVANNTTGAFAITCKTAAAAGQIIPQGYTQAIYCDPSSLAILPQTSSAPYFDVLGQILAGSLIASGSISANTLAVALGISATTLSAFNGIASVNGDVSSGRDVIASRDVNAARTVNALVSVITALLQVSGNAIIGGNVTGKSLTAVTGDIVASLGKLRAATRATGSGDTSVATLLADFTFGGSNPWSVRIPIGTGQTLLINVGFSPGPAGANGTAGLSFRESYSAIWGVWVCPVNDVSTPTIAWMRSSDVNGGIFSINAGGVSAAWIAIGIGS